MFGQLPPSTIHSWLFQQNETPQAALNECTCQYIGQYDSIQFINIDIRWYTEEGKHQCQWWSHFQALLHCFEQLLFAASYVLAICGLSRLDIKTYSSINSSAVYPTSTQPLLLSDWWSVLCPACKADSNASSKRHPTLQHLHRLSWRAGKVGCLGTTYLQYSVTCEFSSQATHRTWCSTWTLAEASNSSVWFDSL